MKKLASLLLALMMVLAMAAPAMAATVTVANSTGHTYTAYQIFKGTQAETGADDAPLGDVDWGSGVNGTALLTALQTDSRFNVTTGETTANIFVGFTTAAQVAEALSKHNDDSAIAKAFANVVAENLTGNGTAIDTNTTTLDTGYYLIVDTTTGSVDAYNSALLQVTKDISITKKYSVPSVDKTITGEGEAADYNIGDTVSFTLTGTLPSNYADYETYKYVFHDTLSTGLSYDANSAKVYVVNGTTEIDVTSSFTITSNTCNKTDCTCNLQISCSDLKKIADVTIDADSKIVVKYTAKLNSSAVIGSAGNKNDVYVEYSNNPNHEDEGKESTGNTLKDEVIVFTYKLDVTKTDNNTQNPAKLKDAEFKLYRKVKVEDAEVTEYVKVDADGKVTDWTQTETEASVLKSDANGLFSVIGLDAGTYYLQETKAPAGYNLITTPFTVVITATITDTEDEQALTALTIKVDNGTETAGTIDDGKVAMTVVNKPGSTLPETGGMGTTLIYTVGALLVAGAVVVMISKKRAASK